MTTDAQTLPSQPTRAFWLNDPAVRGVVIQVVTVVALVSLVWWIAHNAAENLRLLGRTFGFEFLGQRAGFDIGQKPIAFTPEASYGRAIVVGIANTLILAAFGIVAATVLGFVFGIGRLSHNVLVRGISTAYVEIFRNIPPLLVIIFWYNGVLSVLQPPRNLEPSAIGVYLTNRGLQTPRFLFDPVAWATLAAFAAGALVLFVMSARNRRRQAETGQRRPMLWPAIGLLIAFPSIVFLASGVPVTMQVPTATRFNLVGGFQILPEFLAMFLALSIYTGAFIAEIVRAGIMAVSKGQTEAAAALGLRRWPMLRLVIIPQALRVVIPPLTSQYLNLTKNSSLGLAVGYADLVAVGNTVLNQSSRSIEIVAIWMAAYLTISLVVSFAMNVFNSRMALVER